MPDLYEGQLRTLLHATGLAVAACDADGWLTVLSPALQESLGSFEPVHVSQFVEHFGLRDASGEVPLDERDIPLVRALAGEVVRDAVITAMDRAGGLLHFRNNAAPVRGDDGSLQGAVVLVQDITGEQAARREREELRSRLVETVNHELRTPLAKLQGHVELLHEDVQVFSPAHQKSLLVMDRAVQELCGTVRVVSELNDLEAHTRLRMTDTDLEGLLHDVGSDSRLLLTGRGEQLVIEALPERVSVRVDPIRVRRALLELVNNAAVFGPAEGEICVRAVVDVHAVALEVTDAGTGIASQERGRLVKPFERGAHARQPVCSKGLGLSLARHVALAHGGQLLFSDDAADGFTVTLRLPR